MLASILATLSNDGPLLRRAKAEAAGNPPLLTTPPRVLFLAEFSDSADLADLLENPCSFRCEDL